MDDAKLALELGHLIFNRYPEVSISSREWAGRKIAALIARVREDERGKDDIYKAAVRARNTAQPKGLEDGHHCHYRNDIEAIYRLLDAAIRARHVD